MDLESCHAGRIDAQPHRDFTIARWFPAPSEPTCDGISLNSRDVHLTRMPVEARIRVHHKRCVSERTHGGSTITQIGAPGHSSIFLVTGEGPEDLDGLLRELEPRLSGYALLCRSPVVAMARGGCPPSGVEECIMSYGCSILFPALFSDGRELYRLIAPTRERLKQLLERLQEFGGANLEALAEVGPEALQVQVDLGEVAGQLTKKQLAVLSTAVDAGYYDSPRRTSSERLAGSFSLSRTTFEEHLRKAEAKVLRSVMTVISSHPVLSQVARSGGGRFPRRGSEHGGVVATS